MGTSGRAAFPHRTLPETAPAPRRLSKGRDPLTREHVMHRTPGAPNRESMTEPVWYHQDAAAHQARLLEDRLSHTSFVPCLSMAAFIAGVPGQFPIPLGLGDKAGNSAVLRSRGVACPGGRIRQEAARLNRMLENRLSHVSSHRASGTLLSCLRPPDPSCFQADLQSPSFPVRSNVRCPGRLSLILPLLSGGERRTGVVSRPRLLQRIDAPPWIVLTGHVGAPDRAPMQYARGRDRRVPHPHPG